MNEFINPKLADNFLRGGFAILGVDLDFFLARGKGNEAFEEKFCFASIAAGRYGLLINFYDFVNWATYIFKFGQFIADFGVLKYPINNFLGVRNLIAFSLH